MTTRKLGAGHKQSRTGRAVTGVPAAPSLRAGTDIHEVSKKPVGRTVRNNARCLPRIRRQNTYHSLLGIRQLAKMIERREREQVNPGGVGSSRMKTAPVRIQNERIAHES